VADPDGTRDAGCDPRCSPRGSQITYLLGWMSADDAKPGLTERDYAQAVRLTEQAGNRGCSC
jgi:hypothetical protein